MRKTRPSRIVGQQNSRGGGYVIFSTPPVASRKGAHCPRPWGGEGGVFLVPLAKPRGRDYLMGGFGEWGREIWCVEGDGLFLTAIPSS